jgi:catechol 2,3-dioxygenase-like lactoylglutathione lyase family enzyme
VATVRYLVDDLAAAVDWYVERLGFSEGDSFGPVTIVQRDGLDLWLSGPGSSALKQPGAAPGGSSRLVLQVDDLDAAAARLQPRGDVVGGGAGRWLIVEDPSGNPVELFEAR